MNEESAKSFKDSLFNALNLFNNHEWYEAHDAFEEIWHQINGHERLIIQAILQIAVAEVHLENGNVSGAVILYGEGFGRIVNNNLPNTKDLEIHLSTIFTEVRLKNYLEIRSLDACEWDCHCAGPAFFTGILYGNLDESLELIKKWNIDEVLNAYIEAPKKGLNVDINGKSIFEWSKIFLNISKEGLISRNNINSKKNDETVYLKNIENILRTKKTKAQETLDNLK